MDTKTDTVQSSAEALRYPWENHPGHDQVVEVMPGVLWVRLKLPFRLNHVNIYLLADGDGWAMVDAGFGNEETIAAWTTLFEGPLKHVKITRLIVTHSHPDHVGLAGWIVERFNCPLHMSQVEYLQSVYHQNRGTEERKQAQRLFFRRHGMDESLTEKLLGRGQDYLKRVSVLPPSYHRISHGDEISIGTRRFKVITGGGHALDQVMLYCAADKLFLSADQVLSKISPNISVWAVEPDQNSLGEYLASLASLTTTLPWDVMVLPGHGVPFLRPEDPHQATGRSSRGSLPADRGSLPGGAADLAATGAGRVPQIRTRRASDGLCRRRTDRACQLHAQRRSPDLGSDRRRAALPDDLIAASPSRTGQCGTALRSKSPDSGDNTGRQFVTLNMT